jgi:Uma2 family endonuclease
MTVMAAHEPLPTMNDDLLSVFLNLDTPPGYRAELIEGVITVTPPPDGDHEDIIGLIVSQVSTHSKVAMLHSGNKGLELPQSGPVPRNHFIPDATFAPRDLRLFRGAPPWMDPEGVAMVVEVTSSDAKYDRGEKRLCYAQSDIPLYLLIDRDRGSVVLFSDPTMDDEIGDDYRSSISVPFGKPLPLPDPFGFELDTSDFPASQ